MPDVKEVLAGAVEALGGEERPGQIQMAEAVARAMKSGEHLLVQAGTGTGKSLGYLVPALLHHRRVVVATATRTSQAAVLRAAGADHVFSAPTEVALGVLPAIYAALNGELASYHEAQIEAHGRLEDRAEVID